VTRVALGLLLSALWAAPSAAQAPPPASTPAWRPFSEFGALLGSWSGTASSGGRIGGRIDRFTMELSGSCLVHRGSTLYPAEEGKPEETFEEVTYITYDREKRKYVAAGFFSTGVWGTFDVEFLADGGFRMTSAALVNYEAGARSRLSFSRRADGGLDAAMELAPAGKDFALFLRGSVKKK